MIRLAALVELRVLVDGESTMLLFDPRRHPYKACCNVSEATDVTTTDSRIESVSLLDGIWTIKFAATFSGPASFTLMALLPSQTS